MINLEAIAALNNELGLGKYGEVSAFRYKVALDHIADQLVEGSRVCEIGPGGVIAYVARNSDAQAFAIVNPEEHHWDSILPELGVKLIRSDLNSQIDTTLEEEQFDCVIFLETIEHLNRWPAHVIEDIHNLLKPGGVLILSTPNLVRIKNRVRLLLGRPPADPFKYTPHGEHHVREFAASELVDFFSQNQWEIESVSFEVRSKASSFSVLHFLKRIFPSLVGTIIFMRVRRSLHEKA